MSVLRLPRKAKPTAVMGRDDMRPALRRAQVVTTEDGRRELLATDSYRLVALPLTEVKVGRRRPPKDGPLGAHELKLVEKTGGFTVRDGKVYAVDARGREVFAGPRAASVTGIASDGLTAAMWRGLLKPLRRDRAYVSVTLSVDLLRGVADAFGAAKDRRVELLVEVGPPAAGSVAYPLTPIRVYAVPGRGDDDPYGAGGGRGLLMPIRHSADHEGEWEPKRRRRNAKAKS